MGERARLRVLVIEDDRDVAEALCIVLRSRGHVVERAASGCEGVRCAKRFMPEVVVCDIGLRGGPDGFAVAADLRADHRLDGTRLIAFTAYSGLERQVHEAGFEHYLMKPMDVDKLLTVVESSTP